MKRSQRAFTLIELLVVISIISLLSSVVYSSISSARAKARDAKRILEIKQLQIALQLYYEANGSYITTANDANDCTFTSPETFSSKLQPLVTGGYISRIPNDPLYPSASIFPQCYWYKINDRCSYGSPVHPYILIFRSETSQFNLPLYYTTTSYCVYP